MNSNRVRISIIVVINLSVGLLHFIIGPDYAGPAQEFIHGYLIDITLPFALYFLLRTRDYPLITHPLAKAGLVFAIGAGVETAQFFNLHVFGSTFDPLDYFAYGVGVLLAGTVERLVFARWIPGWE